MSGFIQDDEDSIANGIPARQIGPETGSFGNAIMTRRGGTSEGTNEADDTAPAPAAGFGAVTDSDSAGTLVAAEAQTFADRRPDTETSPPATGEETIAQQIADGGDHYKHGQTLHHER